MSFLINLLFMSLSFSKSSADLIHPCGLILAGPVHVNAKSFSFFENHLWEQIRSLSNEELLIQFQIFLDSEVTFHGHVPGFSRPEQAIAMSHYLDEFKEGKNSSIMNVIGNTLTVVHDSRYFLTSDRYATKMSLDSRNTFFRIYLNDIYHSFILTEVGLRFDANHSADYWFRPLVMKE